MRESVVQLNTCNHAKSLGCLVYPFKSPSNNNVPDRLIVPPTGSCFFIEFKQFGKTPTKAQAAEHERMRANGCTVYVVECIKQGVKIINQELGVT